MAPSSFAFLSLDYDFYINWLKKLFSPSKSLCVCVLVATWALGKLVARLTRRILPEAKVVSLQMNGLLFVRVGSFMVIEPFVHWSEAKFYGAKDGEFCGFQRQRSFFCTSPVRPRQIAHSVFHHNRVCKSFPKKI